MSGIFSFKTGTPATDIVTVNDGGGTVYGLDIIFDALQDEPEAANIDRFSRSVLQPLGLSTSTIGATYSLDAGADTFTLQLRKTNGLYDMEKLVNVGRVVKYCFDQTLIDVRLASAAIVNGFDDYTGDRLTSKATFITFDGLTGNPILHFNTLATDIVGSNALTATKELFESYVKNMIGLNISFLGYQYSIVGTDFMVNVPVGTSSQTNTQYTRFASVLAEGSLVSFYKAAVGTASNGLISLAT